MKIVCIKGGLGNQLFEYCLLQHLTKRFPQEKIYLYYEQAKLKQHGGLMLSRAFRLQLPPQKLSVALAVAWLKALRRTGLCSHLFDERDDRALLIDDYGQDKRYLKEAAFPEFRIPERLSKENKNILEQIEQSPFSVSVHVRRGDYLSKENLAHFGACSEEYYRKATALIAKEHPGAVFFLFSDDKEWLSRGFSWMKAVSVAANLQEEESYLDMWLMSRCKGHILANSTFSFWGAMLSRNNRCTIYPAQWYADPTWQTPEIFSETWVKL